MKSTPNAAQTKAHKDAAGQKQIGLQRQLHMESMFAHAPPFSWMECAGGTGGKGGHDTGQEGLLLAVVAKILCGNSLFSPYVELT